MKPSIGRIVHYVAYGTPGGEFPAGACRAAIAAAVTETDPHYADLCVMNPGGLFFNQRVHHDEMKKPGSWHWPEREPE